MKCVICGRDLPITETQIVICTKDTGIESACLCHEFSDSLKQYVNTHRGRDKIENHLHCGEHNA